MKTVKWLISMPRELAEKMDSQISKGLYSSRSEYIRETIRQRLEMDGELKDA